ncbi:MAG: hypothetical protein HYY77_03890 [Betaproteobacteria bacterium]|nr:hypothetical protein [Betaproteobacteria bacterium]
MQAQMLFAAEKPAAARMAFAARQMYPAVGAAHHVFDRTGGWRLLPCQGIAVFFQYPPDPHENQNDEKKLAQSLAPPKYEMNSDYNGELRLQWHFLMR